MIIYPKNVFRSSFSLGKNAKFFNKNFSSSNIQIEPKQVRGKYRTNYELIRPVQSLLENGTVLISKSENIFDNLALEEWIYRNLDFSEDDRHLLLLWYNRPTVVIGRHQNVWQEVAVDYCLRNGVEIARRNSGGGTVYHDQQNLNLSFMTSKSRYNRTRNLSFISDILRDSFRIDTEINHREDLIIRDSGEKVSGTASKLNGYNSYHHCTLLVDVDRDKLRKSLRKSKNVRNESDTSIEIESNATKSVPSPVLNLRSLNNQISIDSLIERLSTNFATKLVPSNSASLSSSSKIVEISQSDLDSKFGSTIHDIRSTFESWQWRFGKTPKFSLRTSFDLPDDNICRKLTIVVEKGLIREISISSDDDDDDDDVDENLQEELNRCFVGIELNSDQVNFAIQKFQENCQDNQDLVETIGRKIYDCYKFCVFC